MQNKTISMSPLTETKIPDLATTPCTLTQTFLYHLPNYHSAKKQPALLCLQTLQPSFNLSHIKQVKETLLI